MEKHFTLMDDLAIIILNYNSFEDTNREVNSLLSEGIPEKSIYVVDNNSKDRKEIEKLGSQKQINCILSDYNGGYAYGNNLAIRKAIEDGKNYFLLLNPDIEISLSTISQLYRDLKEFSNIGIIGPRICYRNIRERIFSDGGLLFPEEGFQGGHTNSEKDKNTVQAPHYNYNIKYVDGSALMFRKEILDEVGLMNTTFFMYYEESEWCLRLLKNNKWKIAVNTHCEAFNLASDKGSFYEYYITRNRIWMCRLYDGNLKYVTKERWKLARKALKKGKFSMAKAYIKGILDGLYFNLEKIKNEK
ncbi:glycosyltransferase family 2 protein [Chryseobacterium sp. MEBOG07]|uniref:glycosyltransferase family 2 protein n=1 Tax=Chryseobacterium sp. MEBOG07 TaxID=2879939 RepID=UPI001F164B47|nr:glycosyltransferase family 2 protein [Chryseobacterium sp. MEBOG07]UKB80120.1 glycosyltransferase family 2 protein [Chryseobacterium sp. MEBOG07]